MLFYSNINDSKVYGQIEKDQKMWSVGLGSSLIGFVNNKGKSFSSPVFNGLFDYGLNEYFSIGAGISYQSIKVNYDLYSSTNSAGVRVTQNFYDKYNRTNIGLRLLYHTFYNDYEEDVDIYGGTRLSYTFWDVLPGTPSGFAERDISTLGSNSRLKVQAIVGGRYFITDNLGLNGEIAVGPTYFVNLGLSYRISVVVPGKKYEPSITDQPRK